MNRLEGIILDNQASFKVPLKEKRFTIQKDDPAKELVEIYTQIDEMEVALSRALEVSLFMTNKNKDLLEQNRGLVSEISRLNTEKLDFENTMLNEVDAISHSADQVTFLKVRNQELEQENKLMAKELDIKAELLDAYELEFNTDIKQKNT